MDAKGVVLKAINYVKERGNEYMDLSGRRLVDSAIAIMSGHLLLAQGARSERKRQLARRYIGQRLPQLRADCELICSGDASPLEEIGTAGGPGSDHRLECIAAPPAGNGHPPQVRIVPGGVACRPRSRSRPAYADELRKSNQRLQFPVSGQRAANY